MTVLGTRNAAQRLDASFYSSPPWVRQIYKSTPRITNWKSRCSKCIRSCWCLSPTLCKSLWGRLKSHCTFCFKPEEKTLCLWFATSSKSMSTTFHACFLYNTNLTGLNISSSLRRETTDGSVKINNSNIKKNHPDEASHLSWSAKTFSRIRTKKRGFRKHYKMLSNWRCRRSLGLNTLVLTISPGLLVERQKQPKLRWWLPMLKIHSKLYLKSSDLNQSSSLLWFLKYGLWISLPLTSSLFGKVFQTIGKCTWGSVM